MAGETEGISPQPIPDHEPSRIRVDRFDHSTDRLNAFKKAIKLIQNKLGLSPHVPKEGQISGKQYYSVDRSQVQSKQEISQTQTEPGNP